MHSHFRAATDVSASPRQPPVQRLNEMTIAFREQGFVLLTGESGTGKAYLARKLHNITGGEPAGFHEVHLPSPAEEVACWMASPVPRSAMGLEAATSPHDGQTIVLRGIEGLSERQQLAVLKTLADTPVAPGQSRIRWVFTTSVDLRQRVGLGSFRSELYYRVGMFRFELPPLRSRRDEIPALTREFVRYFAERYGKTIPRIEDRVITCLQNYAWPGNLRELKHSIERAILYCQSGVLSADLLPVDVQSPSSWPGSVTVGTGFPGFSGRDMAETPTGGEDTLGASVAEVERERIERVLQRNLQSRTRAARELGISRVTLYNKMKKLGISTRKCAPK
ncbi:MAG: helix-turn-helix domain-containing protein [Planctomycetaceae bacterium]|nr:sigma-54-dependent Fis family transcriptional regulator [Planctomycetaceae bacterium]